MGPLQSSLMSIQDLMASYKSSLSKLHEESSEEPLQKFAIYHLPKPSLTLPAGRWKYVTAQVKTCVGIVVVQLTILQDRCYAILASSCNARLCLDAHVTGFSMPASHHIAMHFFSRAAIRQCSLFIQNHKGNYSYHKLYYNQQVKTI